MANQIVVSAGAKVRNLQDVIIGTSGVLTSLGFDVANGVPRLDVNGKILVSQLPNSVMEYKGTWSAATNTPTLANGTGNQGDVYLCNVAGTVDFGAGPIAFVVGDQVIYSGSIWQRASGATGTVTSVAVTESGDSLNITGSPITTSGTINIGFNGTNLQYVNGAGNLTTFPILTGYVPYTGATANVDLDVFSLNAKSLHIKGTAGNGHLGLKHQSASATASANEVSLFADSLGDLSWLNGNLYLSKFITSSNTAARSYTFPNANGTVALTSDLANYVDLTTAQTIAGTKTFNDATKNNGGIFLQNASSSSLAGYMNLGGLTNGVKFTSGGGISNTFTLPSATGYTFTFPNATGTIALTSDIPTNPVGGTGTTNTLPKFTAASTIGNSNITDTGSLITLGSNTFVTNNLGLGNSSLTQYGFRNSLNITGAGNSTANYSDGQILSGVVGRASYYETFANTADAAFTNAALYHYRANQSTFGASSVVTNQYGYSVESTLIGATNNYGFFGNIPSGTNRWNLYMNGTANNYLAGSLGIGATALTGINLYVGKNITGATTSYGVVQNGTVQSDVTSTVYSFVSSINTAASAFTLSNYYHFYAAQNTIGATSAVTNQYGFVVESSLIGATNNYGFFGNIPSGTNRWNIYMVGTANNYMAGSLGIGATNLTGVNLFVSKTLTGGVDSYHVNVNGIIQSDVTNSATYFRSSASTAAASFAVGSLFHYVANQGSLGAGSSVGTQTGFQVNANLIGATNNYGFRGQIPSGTNRWNLFMDGTANNYLAGALGIGGTSLTNTNLLISKNITGSASFYSVDVLGTIQSDVVTSYSYRSNPATAAATFSTDLIGFFASQGTIGAGSTITSHTGVFINNLNAGSVYGVRVLSSNTGSSTAQAFRGDLAAATNVWNLYMNGTANNYMAGSLGIGTTSLTGINLAINKTITGATSAYGVYQNATIQSDVTTQAYAFRSNISTAASAFTLSQLFHYQAVQGTIGATSAVTSQFGFAVDSSLIGATNNYGFFGNIASGTNRWNIYMSGTANNYLAGNTGIGTTTTNSFLNIGAGTTAKAQINLATSVAPTTPNDGDIWFDGTAIKVRVAGVTRTIAVV